MAEDRSLTWSVALLGAGSALAGALIGSVTSVVISDRSYEQQRQVRIQEQRRDAYTELLAAAQTQKARLDRTGQGLPLPMELRLEERSAPFARALARQIQVVRDMPAELTQPITLVFVYGSPKAVEAAADLQIAIADASADASGVLVGELPGIRQLRPKFFATELRRYRESIDDVQQAISDLILTMREDVGPPFDR